MVLGQVRGPRESLQGSAFCSNQNAEAVQGPGSGVLNDLAAAPLSTHSNEMGPQIGVHWNCTSVLCQLIVTSLHAYFMIERG